MNILYVDDQFINQKVARMMLSRLECTFDIAANGKEALEKLADSDYDVVFMDLTMPVMDGQKAAQIIRQNNFRPPYLVALTGHAEESIREECLENGFDEFLAKPITLERIRQVLSSAQTAIAI